MNVFDFINEKRLGGEHSEADIREFIREYTDGNIPDYQAAAWLMAVCIQGMTPKETAVLTDAMAHSGEMLDPLPGKFCVDKHSTGGVGDKVTLFAEFMYRKCRGEDWDTPAELSTSWNLSPGSERLLITTNSFQ